MWFTSGRLLSGLNPTEFGNVKIYLTDRQVLRLLYIGGRCNLFTVRSIQSTENVHDEPIPTHRALCAGASSGFSHDRFRTRFPVGVADDVIVIRHSCLILRVTQGRAGLSQTPMYSLILLDIRNGRLCTRSWDNRPVALGKWSALPRQDWGRGQEPEGPDPSKHCLEGAVEPCVLL